MISMEKEITRQELIDYFHKNWYVLLDERSLLIDDLQIDGLDAEILFENLARDFDFTLEKFDYHRYAATEYELGNIFLTIYRAIFDRKKLIKQTFTVDHLVEVIKKGAWFDPPA